MEEGFVIEHNLKLQDPYDYARSVHASRISGVFVTLYNPLRSDQGKLGVYSPRQRGDALDCTTRAICFVSRDGYASVRERQNRVAREIGTRWNNSRTLDRILKDCGYVSFRIEPKVTRKRIVEILKDIANPIVTASYRHVAPSLHNMIFDTFQSENGRCHHIFVHRDDERKVRAAFKRVRI